MRNPEKAIRWSRRLSTVERWGVLPTIRRQNTAEHSFHVAITVQWLLTQHARGTANQEFAMRCINAALWHDIEEAAEGDSPGPTKGPKDYSTYSEESLVVKLADLIESYWFLCEEEDMGNNAGVKMVKNRIWGEISKCASHFPCKFSLSDLLSKVSLMGSRSYTKHPVLETYE